MTTRRTKPIPGLNTSQAFSDIVHQRQEELAVKQAQEFDQNDKTAKELVNNLPSKLLFPVVILQQQRAKNGKGLISDPVCQEVSTVVHIINKNPHTLTYQPLSGKPKEISYPGFCLLTKLVIRQENGLLVANQDYIQLLLNQHTP